MTNFMRQHAIQQASDLTVGGNSQQSGSINTRAQSVRVDHDDVALEEGIRKSLHSPSRFVVYSHDLQFNV